MGPQVTAPAPGSRVQFVTHLGRSVLLVDASHLDVEGAQKVFIEERVVIASQPKGSTLTLTDVSGTAFDESRWRSTRPT
ncbi:MAG: hypothetical protein QM765_37080 [Myxococcales bacterium]